MLRKLKKQSDQKGFTIIEVLIVLAIAGLIMLIVFLAIPSLQRKSRTTQAKSGAAAILGAVSDYQNNNNGAMPTAVNITADGTITVSGSGSSAEGKTQGGYTAAVGTTFPNPAAVGATTGAFTLALNMKCNGNTTFIASPRAIAVAYLIENGNGNTLVPQCVES